MKTALAILALLGLAGCAGNQARPEGESSPAVPVVTKSEGAIFSSNQQLSLFEDIRARQVGDVLTIILVERTIAKKSASTSSNKDSAVDLAVPGFFGKPIPEAGVSIEAGRTFTGGGDAAQSNQLDGKLTVTVVERLANGNLRVQGEKQLELNQGDETVRLTGIVRPADIAPDNTVLSSRVADAHIIYAGSGALADSNASGWLTRIFGSPWFPF
jgi:flagellar L-ring protein precursor FlgH